MIVKSFDIANHVQYLEQTFQKLRDYRIRLNPINGVPVGKFLDFMLTHRGIEANPDKCKAVLDMKAPQSKKEVQQLTGRLVALIRFLPKSAENALPFFKLLKKEVVQGWNPECQSAFDKIKKCLEASPFTALSLEPNMSLFLYLFLKVQIFLICASPSLSSITELDTLMAIKDSIDPENRVLISWTPHSDPCSDAFEGVACNEQGLVTNISLQGKGLSGRIPAVVAGLKSLTGLYLHFNALNGILPMEIAGLTGLSDLYLNVNNLSGDIPREIGNMSNLQVLQLCYNEFTGSIPREMGKLRKLSVLALQYNQLSSAIPASLGELETLTRLDLSFNSLIGPIPVTLANPPKLESLDIRNNSLSGRIPIALKRLKGGFQYINNPGLCGTGFSNLNLCKVVSSSDPVRPEPYVPSNLPASVEPKANNCNDTHCKKESESLKFGLAFGVIGVIVPSTVSGLFVFLWYRHQKQKTLSTADVSNSRLSSDKMKEVCRKRASPLISLEYSNGWDPLAKGGTGYSQEMLESFMFNLEEVERATQCFSELNLLGKSNFSAIYRGILRDGSIVVIKCIAKTSCKSDETEFLKGLKILTSLKHENLVRFRGFCCSKGRGECFLIYDFVSNGSLLQYLDVKRSYAKVLEWSTRVSIIHGIAKGIGYLHGRKGRKHALVHQNISAEKVLLDARYNSLLADSGLHKLLADDVVFSSLKASAAMGYLAPEYTSTGRLTEKSDVYAFGVIVFQLLTGKRNISELSHQWVENASIKDIVDENLEGKFSESEAAKLVTVALLCTHESPHHRPSMDNVMQELDDKL
ncbi:probable leucine-rich repeat receptor-like serine/threonine-protein kinase At3g14840 [Gastrolobium bilobum]|uniref:probable leucine-rich repeat receptor-like serine/threonine-protein kinase At3g14840 n=1 Tax=Gastrolobium bilobum TaxID=150636 RepID=UPI002AB11861|nr:probable leucine-rich repeat receptor-like serine/threonine-protein kinase At3g14840 [Gastrolobium bilobum]